MHNFLSNDMYREGLEIRGRKNIIIEMKCLKSHSVHNRMWSCGHGGHMVGPRKSRSPLTERHVRTLFLASSFSLMSMIRIGQLCIS